jgi:hypothetical protein
VTRSRKKPGVAFWATVVLVVVLLYPLSFGPSRYLACRLGRPKWLDEVAAVVFRPHVWMHKNGPRCLSEAVRSYDDLWPCSGATR